MVTFPKIIVGLLLLGVVSAPGCVRAQAKAPLATPGLATPDPPERVIVPAPEPEVAEPAPPPPAAPAPRPQNPAPSSRPTDRQPPAAATPAPAPPPVVAPEPPPVQLLQSTADPTEVEKQTKAQLAIAQRDVDRAASRQLSRNAREQLATARGFIRQSEDLLKAKNFVLAREFADKAASLASQLAR